MGCSGLKPSFAFLNDLNKSVATDHTVCVYVCVCVYKQYNLIVCDSL